LEEYQRGAEVRLLKFRTASQKKEIAVVISFTSVFTLFCMITLLTGCWSNNENGSGVIPRQKNETLVPIPSVDTIADDLLKAASTNDFSKVSQIIDDLQSEKLDPVLLKVLQKWHQYRYPDQADLKLVNTLLKKGAHPNAKDEQGEPALYIARNLDMLKVLINDPRANLNERDAGGNTLLFRAIGQRKLEVVKFLLERGADPNAEAHNVPGHQRASDEVIPLYFAIQADETEGYQIVQTLLDSERIHTNIRNHDGLTPREFALKIGNTEVAKLLEERGKLSPYNGVKSIFEN
jgi:ankyrin repeat protein